VIKTVPPDYLAKVRWSDAIALALACVWLAQLPLEGIAPEHVTAAELTFGLSAGLPHCWQLITYELVHTWGVHIVGNLFVLALVCKVVELSTPRGSLPLVFALSALSGAILQVSVGPLYLKLAGSVGASGGILGIGVFSLAQSARFTRVPLRYSLWALFGMGISLYQDFTGFLQHGFFPQIHLGGELAGACFSLYYVRSPQSIERLARAGNVIGYVLLTLSAFIASFLVMQWL